MQTGRSLLIRLPRRRPKRCGHAWTRGCAGAPDQRDGQTRPRAGTRRLRRGGRMKAFADLLDRLSYSPSRNAKLRLMVDYFRTAPDPDRGWALAALTDGLLFAFPLRRTLTEMMDR